MSTLLQSILNPRSDNGFAAHPKAESSTMVEKLVVDDIIALVAYFVLVIGVGVWTTCRPGKDNATGYFLAGKKMHWIPVGASLFASNVGAPMFIGLAGAAAANGFSVAVYEWHGVYLLIALGWLFVPVYVACGSFTMPEYLYRRFGGKRIRVYLSALALVLYVLTRISSEIYSGALFVQLLMGWNLYYCVVGILVITAFYTVIGGLAAVIYTDTLQTAILLTGSLIVMITSFGSIDGYSNFKSRYMEAAANYTLLNSSHYSCGMPRADAFHIWRDPVSGDIPWPGALTGITILGMWVWCFDQIIVQRSLAAKNVSNAKAGSLMAGALKLTPFFLWIIPGMISRVLYPDEVACASPEKCFEVCQNPAGCSNIAYPLMVLRILPRGVKGVMLAAVLSAQMSTLTSVFNSASSIFAMDIWPYIRKKPSQNEIMLVGRLCVMVLTVFGILWLPVMQQSQGGQLWAYVQSISAYTAPPWVMIFLFGIFWTRTTEKAAFWGLMAGLAAGLPRLILEFVYPAPNCGSGIPDERPAVVKNVHFSYFAVILAVVTSTVVIIVSLCTEQMSPKQLCRTTWWTRNDPYQGPPEKEATDPVAEQEVAQDEEMAKCVSESDAKTDGSVCDEASVETYRNRCQGKTFGWKVINWMCGFRAGKREVLSEAERRRIHEQMTNIKEDKRTKNILNGVAILLAIFTAFLLGFFDQR